MIILEDVTKTYSSGVPALNGINLHVQKGEFVFIVGKSGSGKSTLIKLLLKELDPTTGKIYVNKKYLNKITRKKLPYLRRDIGVVFRISVCYRTETYLKILHLHSRSLKHRQDRLKAVYCPCFPWLVCWTSIRHIRMNYPVVNSRELRSPER